MSDDWNEPPDAADFETSESGGGSGPAVEMPPEAQEPAPELPLSTEPAQQEPPAAPSALDPLYARLPPGLRKGVEAGHFSKEEAIARHYQGYHHRVDKLFQKNQDLDRRLAAQTESWNRYDARMKKLFETLGIEAPEDQPAPVDPLAPVHQKLDAVLAAEEERQLDVQIATTEGYVAQAQQVMLAEEPEYMAAEEFVANSVLAFQRQQAVQAASFKQFDFFRRDYLQAVYEGVMSEEELIERTAIERAMDIAARMQYQHSRGGDPASYGRDVLGVAYKLGWQPARAQQQQGGNGAAPLAQPPPRSGPRPDPKVQALRQNASGQLPGPATAQPRRQVNPTQIKEQVANMTNEEFTAMMEASADPEQLMKELMKMGAVS